MFTDTTSAVLLLIIIAAVVCAIVAFSGKKNVFASLLKSKTASSLQFSQAANGFPPPLIERPIGEFDDSTTITIEKTVYEEPKIEIDEDEESILLKAAEIVVEKVQDVVNHIVSDPPDHKEVSGKIKAIVSQYRIFHDTEYFDAINSFIAVTVERDCNIKFTKDELMQLWG